MVINKLIPNFLESCENLKIPIIFQWEWGNIEIKGYKHETGIKFLETLDFEILQVWELKSRMAEHTPDLHRSCQAPANQRQFNKRTEAPVHSNEVLHGHKIVLWLGAKKWVIYDGKACTWHKTTHILTQSKIKLCYKTIIPH